MKFIVCLLPHTNVIVLTKGTFPQVRTTRGGGVADEAADKTAADAPAAGSVSPPDQGRFGGSGVPDH